MNLRDFESAVLETLSSHIIIGVSGVPGAGKTTLINIFIEDFDGEAGMVQSLTTRKPRVGDGNEYAHVTARQFKKMEKRGGEITWKVEAHGEFYGNNFQQFLDALERYRFSLIAITPATIPLIDRIFSDTTRLRLAHIFGPDKAEQVRRLKERGESDQSIAERLKTSRGWDRQVEKLITEDVPIIAVYQGKKQDMYMQLLNSL